VPIRVFVADDQSIVRAGFVALISAEPDMRVVGEASDGAEALEKLAVTKADVVVMDIRMPRMNGIAAIKALFARPAPVSKVLVLTTFDIDEYCFDALRSGASGFLLKDSSADELVGAVRAVYRGDAFIAPSATRRLLGHVRYFLPVSAGVEQMERLTRREREVMRHVALGLSNSEIAERLGVSPGTIKIHIGKILKKLDLRDRVHIVIWAYQHRIVDPLPVDGLGAPADESGTVVL